MMNRVYAFSFCQRYRSPHLKTILKRRHQQTSSPSKLLFVVDNNKYICRRLRSVPQHSRNSISTMPIHNSYDLANMNKSSYRPMSQGSHSTNRMAAIHRSSGRTFTTSTTSPQDRVDTANGADPTDDVKISAAVKAAAAAAASDADLEPYLPYDVNENNDLVPTGRPGGLSQGVRHPTVLNGELAVISFYDSHGDYNKDEEMIQEYMEEGLPVSHREVVEDYKVDEALPSLPIPSVDDTLIMLESSCIPLVENETEHCEFILAARKALMQPMLTFQQRLLRRGDKAFGHDTSWLQLWWNTNCYLSVRTSNVVHVSYFFRFPKPLNLAYNNTKNIGNNYIDDTNIIDKGQSTIGLTSNNRFHSETTLERATILIFGALTYTYPIVYGKGLPIPNPARIKGDQHLKTETPLLCAAQYKYMFGACRIPGPLSDAYRLYQYAPRERSKLPHITVICHGQYYNLVIGDYGPDSPYVLKPPVGSTLDAATAMHMIHDQLIAIVNDARRHSKTADGMFDKNHVPHLGWLTTQNRDAWYKDYQWLIKHQDMQDALHILQSSLFVLCLDDIDGSTNALDGDEADRDFSLRLWHGGRGGMFRDASEHMGGNRYYDKSIQIVMTLGSGKGGKGSDTDMSFGVIGEHSMADGMPVAEFSRYLNQCEEYLRTKAMPFFNSIDKERRTHHTTSAMPTQAVKVHNIFRDAYISLSETDQRYLYGRVKEARYGHIDVTSQYELQVVNTSSLILNKLEVNDALRTVITGLGSHFFKLMKLSPDAGIQMVLQLASYRYFGRAVATYESTHTRRFRHGRTETIRSVTGPSREFCRDLTNALDEIRSQQPGTSHQVRVNDLKPSVQEEIMKIFRRACETHAAYSRLAADGRGCDRHLFGLELLAFRTMKDRLAEEKEAMIQSGASPDGTFPMESRQALEQRIMPTLFKDPVYLRSKHWRLSTSTLPGTAPGFGPVVDDGFGVGYDIRMNHVIYTVTGVRSKNDVGRFCDELERSVVDVYQLLTNAHGMKEHLQHREKHDLLNGPAIMPRNYYV